MSKETKELVDAIANIGKYIIGRVVDAAHDVEKRVEPCDVKPSEQQSQKADTDFLLGKWRRFTEGGEAFQVIAPICYLHEKDDWLMRISLKDGTNAEYLLSQISKSPSLLSTGNMRAS